MPLTNAQRKQIDLQLKQHSHRSYRVSIVFDSNHELKNFIVHKNVLRPEKMAALHLAKYLFSHKELYKNKVVIDMGCGTGIQGIVTALFGAKKVMLTDISAEAVKNTQENVSQYNLNKKCEIYQGDLYERIVEKADLIIFNHPFFSAKPTKSPVSRAMLDEGELFQKFLRKSKEHLNNQGKILTVYFDLAGKINHPQIQGEKNGYRVVEKMKIKSDSGIQRGNILIHELRLL